MDKNKAVTLQIKEKWCTHSIEIRKANPEGLFAAKEVGCKWTLYKNKNRA